jgi:hypothetical protein
MWLFLLSILWRAAATELSEFREIRMSVEDLKRLGAALRERRKEPLDFYPAMLTQLSTRGPAHNMTAIADEKLVPDLETGDSFRVPIFRFYFDGLCSLSSALS